MVSRMLVLSGEVYRMELGPQAVWQPLSLVIYSLDFCVTTMGVIGISPMMVQSVAL